LAVNEFDGIVTISGDGLIHEVVNGIMMRKDRMEFLKNVTIGTIPGGTANGLAKSILDESGEQYGVKEAAYIIAKGRKLNIDLTEYDGEYEDNKIYSFLCLFWSIIADIDINSEVIRCCGAMRFEVWGVYRSLFIRNYYADLTIKGVKVENMNQEIP